MFYKYDIKRFNNEDVLYLYLTMNEEISSELGNDNEDSLKESVDAFLNHNGIKYEGEKVFLVVNGIIIKSLDIKNKNISVEDEKIDAFYTNDNFLVKVKVKDEQESSVKLVDYLLGAMFTNVSYNFDIEVLKAVSILYRSYVFYKIGKDGFIVFDDDFIKYKNASYYKLLWSEKYVNICNKFLKAIEETDSMFVTYNNIFIMPFIHHTNNGYTDSLRGVDYLKKRPSLWDLLSPVYVDIKEFDYNRLEKIFSLDKESIQDIKILQLTESNYIERIRVGDNVYSGEEFRKMLNLKSSDITILINDKNIKFITRGVGHCVGLSLSGSQELSKSGCNFLQILNYYFPDCSIKKYT
ncbi:MAG: SpoIID/LytB domain-containing protein [Bacilli bacterium]|nr:SpoIID/LytB domain-containing protein [Bacilli bacterium]